MQPELISTSAGPQKRRQIHAKETGLYLQILPTELARIGPKTIAELTKESTLKVMDPGETPDAPPITRTLELFRSKEGSLLIPKGIRTKFADTDWIITPGTEGETIPLSLKPLERLPEKLEPLQLQILERIRKANTSGIISAAMGGGKSLVLAAIVLGHPLLRPAAISGKGQKDTKQLIALLKRIFADSPEFAERVMVSGMGRSLSKQDLKKIAEDEGIIICTHAGLQNLPKNVRLLVLDEVHAAATSKRVGKILELPEIKKAYGLTATMGLRGDGGDELLWALIGPTLSENTHEEFEATGRVAPAHIRAYHFLGKGIYAENPFIPEQTPQEGYSTHATWVENHRGRHEFTADLVLWLPHKSTRLIFVPHVLHAARIAKAIEKKIRERYGDLSPEERENSRPVIFHAKAEKHDKFYMSPEEREEKLREFTSGKQKIAIATDFLATGFDTNVIDHIIDASGQKAIITNIQRTGRGIRPKQLEDGTWKMLEIHTILDKTHPLLHKLAEKRLAALCAYYAHKEGIASPERKGGVTRYQDPPWIPQAERLQKVHDTGINSLDPTETATFDPWAYQSH